MLVITASMKNGRKVWGQVVSAVTGTVAMEIIVAYRLLVHKVQPHQRKEQEHQEAQANQHAVKSLNSAIMSSGNMKR
ncbi:hypothetical protein D3C81_1614880 [compost metagenome]